MSKLTVTVCASFDYTLELDASEVPDTVDKTSPMELIAWAKRNNKLDLNDASVYGVKLAHVAESD